MEKKFSYLDTVDFAATVCDKEGMVLFQNERAIERDGDVIGKNLYGCHGEKAGLIELAMELPDNMPVFDRDKAEAPAKPVCEHNPSICCPCPKECPRHGKCCICVAHHREHGKLPACLREKLG